MTTEYNELMALALFLVLVPSVALLVMLRPRRLLYVLRGGEASVCLAMAIVASKQILMVILGIHFPYPGDALAVALVVLILVAALLMWGRVSQVARHAARTRQTVKDGRAYLRSQGVDVDEQGSQ